MSTTTDRVTGRYRQNIPWFVVYSYRGTRPGMGINEKEETPTTTIKKKNVEEKIEDLVKKTKDADVTEKGYNPKVSKLIDSIKDGDLSEKQLDDLEKAILDKKNKEDKQKNL